MGNFVFQVDKVKKLPLDFWDKYNYDYNLSVKEGLNIKTKNGTIGLEIDKSNYVSIIPKIEFEDGILKQISIIPIELSFDNKKLKGLPVIANDEDSKRIYNQLNKISSNYGTKLDFDDQIKVKLGD